MRLWEAPWDCGRPCGIVGGGGDVPVDAGADPLGFLGNQKNPDPAIDSAY